MKMLLSKIHQPPRHRRRLLVEAAWRLMVARATMALLPFRRVSPYLGTHMMKVDAALSETQQRTATEVAWAIDTASRKLPLGTVCIHRAIAAKRMLSARGIPSTLYLGTRKNHDNGIDAHAWVISGNIPVTGATDSKGFTTVSLFS